MISRRTALTLISSSGTLVFAGVAPGARALAAPLPVRKNIATLQLDGPELTALRDGVAILKARTAGQGPTWTDMANIHGTDRGFNKCPHGNWYFLPWHRAYVTMYERMIRAVTGYAAFAMPYWDWTAIRTPPQAFSDPTYKGRPNPLYDAGRNNSLSLPDNIVGPAVMQQIFGETNYELFGTSRPQGQNSLAQSWITTRTGIQGTLEATPHNNVHMMLGGWMPTARSPMDPIFQMHHGNIDHIWWLWNGMGRQNTSDPLWRDMVFQDNYLAPDGSWYSASPAAVQNIANLGYSYGPRPLKAASARLQVADLRLQAVFERGSASAATDLGVRALGARAMTGGGDFEFAVPTGSPTLKQTFSALGAVARPTAAQALLGSRVVAFIRGLTPPSDDVQVKVFVDSAGGPEQKDLGDAGYVTTIGFFGAGAHAGHDGAGGVAVSSDITQALRDLQGAGLSTGSDEIRLRLEPVDSKTGAPVPQAAAHATVEVVIV